ncbi:hypothetical protein ACLOJK_027257 [Asimina triloba]
MAAPTKHGSARNGSVRAICGKITKGDKRQEPSQLANRWPNFCGACHMCRAAFVPFGTRFAAELRADVDGPNPLHPGPTLASASTAHLASAVFPVINPIPRQPLFAVHPPPIFPSPLLCAGVRSISNLSFSVASEMRLAIRTVLPTPRPHHVSPAPPVQTRCCALLERATIGARWAEYQGCRNWEGLLDPLDEKLRAEIIRYGKFVQVAYSALDQDTTSPSFATCRFSKQNLLSLCGLLESGYLPTKHLHATSSIQLPAWVDRAPSWISKQSSWIGYVAIAEDEEEVRRLGRRDVVVAFRGTVTCLEWLENMRSALTHLPGEGGASPASDSDDPMVGSGFWSLYTSSSPACRSLRDEVHGEVRRILDKYRGEAVSFTFTGHSLGAALAVITAHDVRTCFGRAAPVTVISFGGPRVGNRSFRRHVEAQGSKVLRIVNADDVITKVPGIVLEEDGRVAEEINASWILTRLREMRWLYDEVGLELRVSNRDSPFLAGNVGDVAKCHELDVYLDLVNGLAGSTCPFKATAKRELRSWLPPQASSWFVREKERAARVG